MKIEPSIRDPKYIIRKTVQTVDFHGACVIDENGVEIPITEQMIQKACQEFDELWESAHRQPRPRALSLKNIRYFEK